MLSYTYYKEKKFIMKCPNCNANVDIISNDDEIICPQCKNLFYKNMGCEYSNHSVYKSKEYRENNVSLLIMSVVMLFLLAFLVFYNPKNTYDTSRYSKVKTFWDVLPIIVCCIACSLSYRKTGGEAAKFWSGIIIVFAGIFGSILLIRYIYGDDYITYLSYFF